MRQRTIPDNPRERVEFFSAHLPVWREHAAELQLSAADLDALEAAIDAATAANSAKAAAQNRARSATSQWRNLEAQMTKRGRGIVRSITALGLNTPGDRVFVAAALPVPSGPSKRTITPKAVTDIRIELYSGGRYNISWRGELDGRTYYTIKRSVAYAVPGGISVNGPEIHIGTTQQRKFLDLTVPQTAVGVRYEITPHRGRVVGRSGLGTFDVGNPSNAAAASHRSAQAA